MIDKQVASLEEAVAGAKDGATILVGGFSLVAWVMPERTFGWLTGSLAPPPSPTLDPSTVASAPAGVGRGSDALPAAGASAESQ